MTTLYFFIMSIIVVLSLAVIGYTVSYRKKIPCMTGMMISMTLGMSVGLTVGVILGIQLTGNLFYSTILGIIIGGATGFLAGLPVSLMAVLDGMLSGLMGGMMGAMLGDMIAPDFKEAMVKIMFVLFIAIAMILFFMMEEEFIKSRRRLFKHPLSLILLFGFIFLGFNQLGPIITESKTSIQGDDHPQHTKETQNKLVIKASEYTFSPEQVKIEEGEKVTVVFKNVGEAEHDLEIIGLQAKMTQSNQNQHQHGNSNNKVHIHAMPGEEITVSFTPVQSGTYQYVCTIPGHKESGMTGFIEVS
ncbi:plastocyanin/azurin family copper-binding protein [Alkalihalobacillus sp. AL-G]|uniref:plastocyanin/azurin family copper-binding protein n=1 Tax=Alkalihalobacillus sp. AL-G TaxID=2926399 RepID=UPI0027297118|nr:plastocyanin/azurin family copper-binding protein [Alkalihalobacillus sp. AL-G]WLD92030.1 plastocyanin/azurin family copper-binding protein [Alkalihalobacillus sp. AL-G]